VNKTEMHSTNTTGLCYTNNVYCRILIATV